MAYSAKVMARARERLEQENANKEQAYYARLERVYRDLPRVRQIDMQLHRNMSRTIQAAFGEDTNLTGALAACREENEKLQAERDALVTEVFGAGYLKEPLCVNCGGQGYIGTTMCSCLRDICRKEQMNEIASLGCGSGRFADFRLDYYPEAIDPKFGASPRFIMEQNLKISRRFAEKFSGGNLLLFGGTGLGKTFLSACIATQVAMQGFSVAYESAGNLFAKLEKDRFTPDEQTARQVQELKDCDLLIIDDLGTELPGSFVTAALYGLVNDRMLQNKSMVISTNLTAEEIAQRYNPQIASRLQGAFQMLPFVGEDIRILKSRGLVR